MIKIQMMSNRIRKNIKEILLYLVEKLLVFINHNSRSRMPKEGISAEKKRRENSANS